MKNYISSYLFTPLLTCVIACHSTKNQHRMDTPKSEIYNKKTDGILRCEIILKAYENKNGKIIREVQEYYLRCSADDYFIKFCECKVSKDDIIAHFNSQKLINPIAVKAKILSGEWDSCDTTERVQSRTGKYVQILEIVSE